MAIYLYNVSIFLLKVAAYIGAIFSKKTKLFVDGRKGLIEAISNDLKENIAPIAWFHCASLGEFEQGRPVMESFKKEFPDYLIVLTFFSPSGFEVRKNYSGADFIYYLPLDTAKNARLFISIVNPTLAYFVKYEFWHHFIRELYKNQIPIISISSIFRRDQLFFKNYGSFYREILFRFNHFFVQNVLSKELLNDIGIKQITVSGDTRFDRVFSICQATQNLPLIEKFCKEKLLMVIGSSWPQDMEILTPFINQNRNKLKFIIAPHEIGERNIRKIETDLTCSNVRLSKTSTDEVSDFDTLIIDNIGMLSSIYKYADFTYVGGAFGKGLHNILEAATFGSPIFFGNRNYKKFQEANDLIELGGAFAIGDSDDLEQKMSEFINDPESIKKTAKISTDYVERHTGATEQIIRYSIEILKGSM
ncbi:glycosyltransferase N-terminal domain-containing protein [Fulvivirgaceae bacterium BMA10]|uniref:3-deoxy-D-manno-octulosonic acid transferase n=1 Tax=Splendidivirga corallicola TaxID=3051826 RepID=A0ABT8KRI8_9BACT|nr:glycosyltransferase N-terminal domain-containing protein [Fulvivirgaceae bacterium BMA10]